jgi:hypothetical protein
LLAFLFFLVSPDILELRVVQISRYRRRAGDNVSNPAFDSPSSPVVTVWAAVARGEMFVSRSAPASTIDPFEVTCEGEVLEILALLAVRSRLSFATSLWATETILWTIRSFDGTVPGNELLRDILHGHLVSCI